MLRPSRRPRRIVASPWAFLYPGLEPRAEAQEGSCGLIVVGSHGPQHRSLFGLDDITRQVLSGTDRPVLVVPADEG